MSNKVKINFIKVKLIKQFPVDIDINPKYIGCLILLYIPLVIKLAFSLGFGNGERLGPKVFNEIVININPKLTINKPNNSVTVNSLLIIE